MSRDTHSTGLTLGAQATTTSSGTHLNQPLSFGYSVHTVCKLYHRSGRICWLIMLDRLGNVPQNKIHVTVQSGVKSPQ